MKFNINDYDKTYVMHCDTREKANVFCKYLHSLGKKWIGGEPYLISKYDAYYERTAYRFITDTYSDLAYYKSQKCNVLEFDDFEWDGYEDLNDISNDVSDDDLLSFIGGNYG